jgi:hypothetical protein
MPVMTATSEIKSPIPQNNAIETNSELSDFADDDTEADGTIRAAVLGMSALQWIGIEKSSAHAGVLVATTKVQWFCEVPQNYVPKTRARSAQPT